MRGARVAPQLRHYLLFVRIGLKGQTIYRFDFLAMLIALLVLNLADLLLLGVILAKFVTLSGWSIWEIVFLYSMYLTALGLQNTFSIHLGELEEDIRDGTLDQVLVRPSPALVQLLGKKVTLTELADLTLGLTGMTVVYLRLGLDWGPLQFAYAVVAVLAGALLLGGIVLGLCSLAFWTVRSRVFVYGTQQIQEVVQHYPARVFGGWFVGLVSTLLPFAFINYWPALTLLGRKDEVPSPVLGYATPVVALVVTAVALMIWRLGLSRYQSTGS